MQTRGAAFIPLQRIGVKKSPDKKPGLKRINGTESIILLF